MLRVRKERMGKAKERRGSPQARTSQDGLRDRPPQEGVFLPSHEHLVKMVALQGADDKEIADMFGVPYEHFKAWRKLYPSFNDALNQGRLAVDAEVTYALYRNTQGFEFEEETTAGKDGHVVRIKKYARPDTSAQKYWLENRRPDLWRSSATVRSTGKDDGHAPDGVKIETRNELIESIVSLIAPKADGKAKPAASPDKRAE